MKKIRYIELFGGIGASTKALQNIFKKKNIELVDYIDIFPKSVRSFNHLYDKFKSPSDIKNSIFPSHNNIDLIVAGFPCQPYSVAGKRLGKEDYRSGDVIEAMIKYIIKTNPKYILLENVKGFMSKKFIELREYILKRLDKWDLKCHILNAKNYGIPQNRERVYITNINFKDKQKPIIPLKEFLDKNIQFK